MDRMKTLLLLLTATLAVAQPPVVAPIIPLEGLDPVALIKGQQLDGDKKFEVIRGQFKYQFANAENKATFEKDPTRYEIQLGGACARMGAQTGGNPDSYSVVEGKIYVFGSPQCQKAFLAAPEKYLESKQPAPAPLLTSAAAVAKGREIIARAIEGIGGPAALDAVRSYRETSPVNQETKTIVFPDQVALHRTYNEKYEVSLTITAETGFSTSQGKVRELPPAAVADFLRDHHRNPLLLLKSRNDAGFRAAALDDTHVAIDFRGDRIVLEVDAATGRIASVQFRSRGKDGFVDTKRTFGDYRQAGGLNLPYEVDGVKLTSITVNPELSASMFAKPQ